LFIFNFVADVILGQILNWVYQQIVGFLNNFFEMMNNMGAELFDMSWVQATVLLFHYFGWALFVAGLVVAGFEYAIESQNGRGNIKVLLVNAFKGFMAVGLFAVVPIELYKFAVTLQGVFGASISGMLGYGFSITAMAASSLSMFSAAGLHTLVALFCIIMMGYAVIKVFFANLKRGGILLIQIAVGSLYMFSVPRGYADGFYQWGKQVVGLCLTAFLQSTILVAGLMVFNANMLLGLGLMLASSEIPRIAGMFGLETGTRANIMSTVYTAQTVVNMGSKLIGGVPK